MKTLIKNIKELFVVENVMSTEPKRGHEMKETNSIKDAFLVIEDENIQSFGNMSDITVAESCCEEVVDATDKLVIPGFCDSHTHIVFAGSREHEFVDKINGLSYEEIAKRGGGILNSAAKLRNTSEDDLYESAAKRLNEMILHGTTAVEIKSGYGLTTDSEIKMLKVIKRLKANFPLPVKANFLGAHAIPLEYRTDREKYIDILINEMIPMIASEKLADYVDSFCDEGFFTLKETERILLAGEKYGLRAKIHANEMANSGGVQLGIAHNAVSVDHLEQIGDAEIEALKNSKTIPTALPGASFFLRIPFSPLRKMVDAGLPLALASDFNPGTCPSGNMQFVMSLATIHGRLLPIEALHAVTINGGFALELEKTHGSICKGKKANILITQKIPSLDFMPYYFGTNKIETVFINGKIYKSNIA